MIYYCDKMVENLDVGAVHSQAVFMPTQTFATMKHHSLRVFAVVGLKNTTLALSYIRP